MLIHDMMKPHSGRMEVPTRGAVVAVSTGLGGRAIVNDGGDDWTLIRADGTEQNAIGAWAWHMSHFYRDASLQLFDSRAHASAHLAGLAAFQRATILVLSVLDAEFPDELRVGSAVLAESKLCHSSIRLGLRRRLLGAPAPDDADLAGGLRIANKAETGLVFELLTDTRDCQPVLAALGATLDDILAELGDPGERDAVALALRNEIVVSAMVDAVRRDDAAIDAAVDEIVRAAGPSVPRAGDMIPAWTRAARRVLRGAGVLASLIGERGSDRRAIRADASPTESQVQAFRYAVDAIDREREPLRWAAASDGLANALQTLGQERRDRGLFEESVAAAEAALEERTAEGTPNEWAMTKYNLGTAWECLGDFDTGTESLERAIAAYRDALSVLHSGAQGAVALGGLASALARLGGREAGVSTLLGALNAYEQALSEPTLRDFQDQWASMQLNRGNVLVEIAEREPRRGGLERAVESYEAALGFYTKARTPTRWAMAQVNLAMVLRLLGERDRAPEPLRRAVEACTQALTIITQDSPEQWAVVQGHFASSLMKLGELLNDPAAAGRAVDALRDVLRVSSREASPVHWAMMHNNLGSALSLVGELTRDGSKAEEAVEAFEAALTVLTPEHFPRDNAIAQANLDAARESTARLGLLRR